MTKQFIKENHRTDQEVNCREHLSTKEERANPEGTEACNCFQKTWHQLSLSMNTFERLRTISSSAQVIDWETN